MPEIKAYLTTFVSGGFSNWKNALKKFREHESSNLHKESAMKLAARRGVGIDAQLSSQLRSQQAHHRTMLMRLLESIQFLARQGLPLRGHKEDVADLRGNLYQLLLLRGKECHGLASWLKDKEYSASSLVDPLFHTCTFCIIFASLSCILHLPFVFIPFHSQEQRTTLLQ